MTSINGMANKILIVLAILIRCSLMLPSQNGTYDGMMLGSNDLQCLTEMPVSDLMKIRKAIRMMHAVSAYDEHQMSNTIALKINNQNQNQNDSLLRELPVAETHKVFQYFTRFTTTTTKSPLAQPFMMTGLAHDVWNNGPFTHKTGYATEWEEEKPSKVQKVLHYSITALSFLAFAGYLLCMIVQAIKSKGTTYYHPSVALMEIDTDKRFVTANRVSGIRPNRFRRNTKASERITIAEPDPMSMFKVLLAVSKGYVQLSSILQPPR